MSHSSSNGQVSQVVPRVVIVGAGFAGVNAAQKLAKAPVEVLLIDQNNYHTFQPLLYQVATAGLEVEQIAHTVRGMFWGQRNFRFKQGLVCNIDKENKTVTLADDEKIDFDYLVLAAGAIYNDFGIEGVREHAFFLKSLTEAVNIRAHILEQFEKVAADPALIEEGYLNFVLVGGGPTGVEMAGALIELLDRIMPKDYPEVDVSRAKVILLEMAPQLMMPYVPNLREYTENILRQRGVEIHLDTAMKKMDADKVTLSDGNTIPTKTLLWAAGVRAHPLAELLGTELERGYRVKVNPDLSVPEYPDVFVVGDIAGIKEESGAFCPQVAQVAIQSGKYAAKAIGARLQNEDMPSFCYSDRGNMAIIGRNAGIVELSKKFNNLKMTGYLGFMGWLFIHLIYLVGFQNRINTLMTWAYNYLTYDRNSRLVSRMKPSVIEQINHDPELIKRDLKQLQT